MLVLESSTDPSGFELRKESVFVNLDGQNPTTSKEIDVPRQLALVCQMQGTVIQVALEPIELGESYFLSIPPLHFWRHSASFDLILSNEPRGPPGP